MLIYLLGFPRSGTTLFQSLLTQNPLIATRPEDNLVGRKLVYEADDIEILKALIQINQVGYHNDYFVEKDTLILEGLDKIEHILGIDFVKLMPVFLIERDGRDCIASYWKVIKEDLKLDMYFPLSKVVQRYNKARQNIKTYYSCFDYVVKYQDLLLRPDECIEQAFSSLHVPFTNQVSANQNLDKGNSYMQGIHKPVDRSKKELSTFYTCLTPSEQQFVLNHYDPS